MKLKWISLVLLGFLITSCGGRSTGETIPAASQVSATEETKEKPTPVMSSLPPLSEALTQALTNAGISAAKGRFDMPDLKLTGPGKRELRLSDQIGKVVFLNLWATWCPPCKKEMPTMEALYKKLQGKPFVMAAVSIGEDPGTVVDFLGENPYTFPVYWDPDNSVTKDLSTGSIPTTYIIGKDGKLVGRLVGATDWNAASMDKVWDLLFKE